MSLNATLKIMETAKNLKDFYFVPNIGTPPRTKLRFQDIDAILKESIINNHSLQFLYVSTRGHVERMCNAINHALFRTKTRLRAQLEIGLLFDGSELSDTSEFVCNITRIVHMLNICNINEWIVNVEQYRHNGLTWEYENSGLGAVIDEWIGSAGTDLQLLEKTPLRFIIGNKDCTMLPRHPLSGVKFY